MTESQETTKVIFRIYPTGATVALFPEEPGTHNPYTCSCYQSVGQHGSADPVLVIADTKRATPKEYESLQTELEKLGYKLEVKARYQHDQSLRKRKEKITRI